MLQPLVLYLCVHYSDNPFGATSGPLLDCIDSIVFQWQLVVILELTETKSNAIGLFVKYFNSSFFSLFNYLFMDFTINDCNIDLNDGDYAKITNCDSNDSDDTIININANCGSLDMPSLDITNNQNGDLEIDNIEIMIMNNNNNNPLISNTLIEMNNFKTGIISNSNFSNNNDGSNLFVASFSGDLDITNLKFTDNNANNSLIEMKNISTLTINSIIISDNNVPNGILFNGTNSGSAIIKIFEFNNHNYLVPSIGENSIQIINFLEFDLNNCNIHSISGEYLFNYNNIK